MKRLEKRIHYSRVQTGQQEARTAPPGSKIQKCKEHGYCIFDKVCYNFFNAKISFSKFLDYLETTDNTLKALIMRYQTLLEMNHSLIQKREELAKQVKNHIIFYTTTNSPNK